MNGDAMTQFEMDLALGEIHLRSSAFARHVESAKQSIERMLSICNRTYISLSFGKQSICMTHLISSMNKNIPAFFLASSETWQLYNFVEVIAGLLAKIDMDITIVQTNRHGINLKPAIDQMSEMCPSLKWEFSGEESGIDWRDANSRGHRDLQDMCNRKDWDGWFWGFSSDESVKRRITLAKTIEHRNIFRYSDGKFRCCPLRDWRCLDIAAYIVQNNLKMLDVYERHGLRIRTTARVTGNMAELGGICKTNISSLNGISEVYREIRTFK